ncbi:hypothetical protein ATANTOWER_022660, partial [Ataeniobius toweri]|nr:hypothetical protein [Ataeniobius toweri]
TEKDKASPSPYLNIRSHGWVEFRNDQVVINTCKMRVYKFPFDIQSCNISFKSIIHSDTGGEKVGFKITILLAVTVMQLILNDILPSSSDKIPIIAVYCIGTFALMLLSLLETIVVIHLIDKDASQDNEKEMTKCQIEGQEKKLTDLQSCFIGIKKCSSCASVNKTSTDGTPFIGKEGGMGGLTEVSLALEKMSDELGDIKKSITLLSGRQEEEKPCYWTRTAQKINKVFAVFYVTATILFLAFVSTMWYSADE